MKHTFRTLLISLGLISFLLTSCGPKKDPLAKERKEMEALNETLKTDVYRALKLALRSLPVDELNVSGLNQSEREKILKNRERDLPAVKLYSLAFHILQAKTASEEDKPGVLDYLIMAKEIVQLRKMLNTLDEDEFPTILSNFLLLGSDVSGSNLNKTFNWYNNDFEHMILGTIWMSYPAAPEEFGVYEMTRLHPEKILVPEVRLLAHGLRGGFFYKQEWYYHCELEGTNYIDMLNSNRTELTTYFDGPLIPGSTVETEDQAYAQLHALGASMRGFTRLKIDEDKKALGDFEHFLEDARTIGLDDEGVWLIGAYVAIQNEQWAEAGAFLDALSASPLFSEDDKKQFAEVKSHIEAERSGKAAAKLMDKVLIAKILASYIGGVLSEVKWQQDIRGTEVGNAFISGMEDVNNEIEKITSHFEGEKLTKEAKEFKEEAGEKIGGFMQGLLDDANGLIDSAGTLIDSASTDLLGDSTATD